MHPIAKYYLHQIQRLDKSQANLADIQYMTDIRGSFRNEETENLFILNDKSVYELTSDLENLTPQGILLQIDQFSQIGCAELIPGYGHDDILKYAVAICKSRDLWVVAVVE